MQMQMRMRSKMLNTCQGNADDNANEIIFTTFTLSRACFAQALSTHNNINHHFCYSFASHLVVLAPVSAHTHVMCQDTALMSYSLSEGY